jgi:hypothetical protein
MSFLHDFVTGHPIISFSFVGWVGNDLYRSMRDRFMFWRLERDYRKSIERHANCKHEEGVAVNTGTPERPIITLKCVGCWALMIDGRWCPNSASLKEAQRVPIRD